MSCRDRVSRLTAVLADAQSQLHSLEKLRSAHIRLSPPIHMLPAEVLLDIFELAVEKPYNFSSIDEGPWRLGQVCRPWRQITRLPSKLVIPVLPSSRSWQVPQRHASNRFREVITLGVRL